MKLHYNRRVILRIPRFPLDARLEDNWPQLKSLIAESSLDFYEKIKDLEFEQIRHQSERVRHTIWKYFNRSKNRSTPFGGLAAVAVCPAAYMQGERKPLKLSNEISMYQLPDWSLKDSITYTFDQLYDANGKLFTNSTYYLVNDHMVRYIGFSGNAFELMEMPKDEFIIAVLEYCRSPLPIQELFNRFPELDYDTFRERIEALVDLQLLKTSFDPNIIGEDYFKRIGFKPRTSALKYAISERHTLDGAFDLRALRGLDTMIENLQCYQPVNTIDRLDNFIGRFRSRYDLQEVPLMLALDPEYGIGYADLEQQTSENEIIAALGLRRISNEQQDDLITLTGNTMSRESICRLQEIDLEPLIPKVDDKNLIRPIPNSMSLLCTLAEDKVWVEHLGGATANALAGRFTLASEEVRAITKEIAEIEAEANPDIIFFDIAYMAETHIDNVNRRQHIYGRQLSLLNYDMSENPITLDDITIELRGNELVLRSRSLKKRLIPRLASAYNHTRSDLSVFRLLCDLQHQGLHTSFNIQLDSQFPNHSFYPRINYRQFVLSPAKWRIKKTDLQPNEQLLHLLLRYDVSRRFRTGIGDQVLYFDSSLEDDVQVLNRILEKQDEILLEETPIPDQELILDNNGNSYTGQFLVQLYHKDRLYDTLDETQITSKGGTDERNFLLHSEWLYFEIFCHLAHADTVLDQVHGFLDNCKPYIKQWFFIRYDENGNHIRLRLKPYHIQDNQELFAKLNATLINGFQQGAIQDICQRIYRREIERYGADIIADVEKHFCIDSVYVLAIIREGLSEMHKYKLCIDLLNYCSLHIAIEPPAFHTRILRVLKSFELEHRLGADGFRQLNDLQRSTREFKAEPLPEELTVNMKNMRSSLIQTVNKCPENRKAQLFTDLFHMHVNRLFRTEQRTHELAIYYMFMKQTR